jgi:hypothetical protein
MQIKIHKYNKEENSFDCDFIEFEWINLKNKEKFEIIQANRYLYFKKVKEYYKNNKIPYKGYLYDTFYEEQFNNIIP